MKTIKDAIRESIDTQNPILIDGVVKDVREMFPDASIGGIKTEACKIMRDGNYRKERLKKSKRFIWYRNDLPLKTKKKPEPKKENGLTPIQIGEGMVGLINHLKSKIQQLADQVSAEQDAKKKIRDHLQGQIDEKTQVIKSLNHKLIAANKRIHNSNGNTFSVSEIARFTNGKRESV